LDVAKIFGQWERVVGPKEEKKPKSQRSRFQKRKARRLQRLYLRSVADLCPSKRPYGFQKRKEERDYIRKRGGLSEEEKILTAGEPYLGLRIARCEFVEQRGG